MRIAHFTSALVAFLLALPLVLTACKSDNQADAEPFDTLAACFNEHHVTESLSVHDAIVVCCVDHPIAGVHPSCGASQAECIGHVTTELGSSATAADIDMACTDYIKQK
jgi:hypothetical protein